MSEKQELNEFGSHNGYEYVDLGLPSGLLWATCNVGADSPEEHGDYFAWGEIEPKRGYSWYTYKFSVNGSDKDFSKYTTPSEELEDIDDAAHVNWGGNWRMPTVAEIEELLAHCTWRKDIDTGGHIAISKNNCNTILFPNGGCRWNGEFKEWAYYWSRTLSGDRISFRRARQLTLCEFSSKNSVFIADRHIGCLVRPVCHRENN